MYNIIYYMVRVCLTRKAKYPHLINIYYKGLAKNINTNPNYNYIILPTTKDNIQACILQKF